MSKLYGISVGKDIKFHSECTMAQMCGREANKARDKNKCYAPILRLKQWRCRKGWTKVGLAHLIVSICPPKFQIAKC